jgi:hypothetical protein
MGLAKVEAVLQHGSRFQCARMMEFAVLPALESKCAAQEAPAVHGRMGTMGTNQS